MANDFLTAMTLAAADLDTARRKHAKLKTKAESRLAEARDRYRVELEDAAAVEAAAWARLGEIPGMTVGTAAGIGGVSEPTAAKWIKRGRALPEQPCN